MARKRLSAAAIKLIHKMIDNVSKDKSTYDQGSFPTVFCSTICLTSYCAAGHLVHAKDKQRFNEVVASRGYGIPSISWAEEAMKSLGLNPDKHHGLRLVLFGSAANWPNEYANRYFKAKTPVGRFNAFKDFWFRVVEVDANIDMLDENV